MQLVSFLVSKLHNMLSERHNGSSLFSLFLILISIPNSKTRVFNMSRGRIIESFLFSRVQKIVHTAVSIQMLQSPNFLKLCLAKFYSNKSSFQNEERF